MQNQRFNPVADPMLQGWREVAVYLGVHPRTVKEWHYKYVSLPFTKDASHRYARWRIRASAVDEWYRKIVECRSNFKESTTFKESAVAFGE